MFAREDAGENFSQLFLEVAADVKRAQTKSRAA
jgi:hypothetical protein